MTGFYFLDVNEQLSEQTEDKPFTPIGDIKNWLNGVITEEEKYTRIPIQVSPNIGNFYSLFRDQQKNGLVLFAIIVDEKTGKIIQQNGNNFKISSRQCYDKFYESGSTLVSVYLPYSQIFMLVCKEIPPSVDLVEMREYAYSERMREALTAKQSKGVWPLH